ncbi:hypothetical protein M434DRAFT_29229 [Hypoxylon sp. CO27-5]|nr:hypothetical protein M434DRAFT_29229 [Hypoxylon sp. CO27-5]
MASATWPTWYNSSSNGRQTRCPIAALAGEGDLTSAPTPNTTVSDSDYSTPATSNTQTLALAYCTKMGRNKEACEISNCIAVTLEDGAKDEDS